jgi:hypothetical protein
VTTQWLSFFGWSKITFQEIFSNAVRMRDKGDTCFSFLKSIASLEKKQEMEDLKNLAPPPFQVEI